MDLVDSNGRFALVRNGQVKLDKSLPKYVRVEDFLKKEKEKEDAEDKSHAENSDMSEPMGSSDDEIRHYLVADSISFGALSDPDKLARLTVADMKKEDLENCVNADDAFEFNNKFIHLLNAEVKNNGYSLSIDSSSILAYADDPVPATLDGGSYMSFLDKMRFLLGKKKDKKRDEKKDKYLVNSLIRFMDTIHVEIGKSRKVYDKIDALFSMIDSAVKMHQTAQLDDIAKTLIINIYECILSAHGYDRFISFEDIEKIDCPGKRLIDIDYVDNFGRVIPDDVVKKKVQCDDFGIFDNYCVMYYDPSGKTYKVPEKTKRDPILFGLINHSPKLYYIADWSDENCDLTLDRIAEIATVRKLDK